MFSLNCMCLSEHCEIISQIKLYIELLKILDTYQILRVLYKIMWLASIVIELLIMKNRKMINLSEKFCLVKFLSVQFRCFNRSLLRKF